MQTPNFNFEQFVDNNIFNSAMASLVSSMREVGSLNVFLLPGVINPASLQFTFNSNLVVTVNAQNAEALPNTPFECLFVSGAITDAHGIVNGTDSSTYSVNFGPLVPLGGSVTAYMVAQYAQVDLSSITIIGAPPGHPDYSANFTPYIGYTVLQDTLNIFATTTAPDNQTTIELARVTLTAGQTLITSVDQTHQVLARVNALAVTMNGDVTGLSSSNRISNLQGDPLAVAGRTPGQVLTWNGTSWAPNSIAGSFPPDGPAGGDLVGTYPNPQVSKSTVTTFTANAISVVGTVAAALVNSSGNVSAAGNLIGSAATAANQAIILSQLGSIGAIAPINPVTAGDIYHQTFQLPVLQGAVVVNLLFNFGFYSFYGLSESTVANQDVSVTYAMPFLQGALFATSNWATNDFGATKTGAFDGESFVLETPQLNAPGASLSGTRWFVDRAKPPSGGTSTNIAGPSTIGLLGFWWLVIGI